MKRLDDPSALVWQPLQVGPHLLSHRIVTTPHGVAWGGTNIPTDRHIAYYAERARGGAALVQVGATSAWWEGAMHDSPVPTVACDPRSVPMYERLADEVHGYGGRVFIELGEDGVHTTSRPAAGNWHPVMGVSQIPSMVTNELPAVMGEHHIAGLREDYKQASRNLLDAGIDGISIHAAHSYLLGQFLSPAYNDRTDRYGGSVANRLRVVIELLESVRETVGDSMALGLRISFDEYLGKAGITPELTEEYLAMLCNTRLLDFVDVSAGGYHTGERYVPPNVLGDTPIAHYATRAREIAAGRLAIIMAHRVNSVSAAEQVLSDGVTDLVGIARGHIADPFLVEKARSGHEDETVQCVGSNECVYALHRGIGVSCTVNPSTGRERAWGHGHLDAVSVPRRVVVVGGGPAGLQAAAVASRRGHSVILLERSQVLGGSLLTLAGLPLQNSWARLAEDLRSRAVHAGVEIRRGVEADADDVLALSPDAVVTATGASWDRAGLSPATPTRNGIPGLESHPLVLTFDEAVTRAGGDPLALGGRVVIVDETGAYAPLGLAEMLTERGVEVVIVSRRHMVGEIAKETWEMPLVMRRMADHPPEMLPYSVVDGIAGASVRVTPLWGGPVRTFDDTSAVVLSGLRHSERSLYDALVPHLGPDAHLIGDAVAPRRPADATYDGELVGRRI